MLIDGLDAAKSILPTNKQVYLAIGFFDGVHLGHQALIGKAIDIAKETDGISAVLTFWPHPSKVFGHEVKLLMTREEKHSKLKRLGVDYIIEQNFSLEFSKLSAEHFTTKLKSSINSLRMVYVGEDFRFGHKRTGNVEDLRKALMAAEVTKVERIKYGGEIVSSTRIRSLLVQGQHEEAEELLG